MVSSERGLLTTGTARVILAIGDPVAQVRFPEVFGRLFLERGVDAACVPMHVPAEGLEAFLRGVRPVKNLIGLSVTIPHKAAALKLLDEVSDSARRVGVINAVRREADGRLVGEIFDGKGFVAGLAAEQVAVSGARAWLVGSGGAGTAISFALLEAGLAHLTLSDSNRERAAALAARLAGHWPGKVATGVADPRSIDLAINATPVGMRESDPLPFDPAMLQSETVVADIIMTPATTRLLAAADTLGLRTQRGHHMLDHQVKLYWDFLRLDALRA